MCIVLYYIFSEAAGCAEPGVSGVERSGGNFTVRDCIRLLGGRESAEQLNTQRTYNVDGLHSHCTNYQGPQLGVKEKNQTITKDYNSVLLCVTRYIII